MLYLILPPIIIIVALVALVYFFSRRFPRVEKEIARQLDDSKSIYGEKSHLFNPMKRISLYILERLAQWFKVMSLKSYNVLHNWTKSLREKKSKSIAKSTVTVSERVLDYEREIASEIPSQPPVVQRKPRPMISQRITQPEEKIKPPAEVIVTKNQLEDILVERIAINPRDLEAYERLGEYYMEQGNLQDAKECYRQVLRLSPVHRLAKIKIRRLEKLLEQK